MTTINYRKYSIKELLDAESSIDEKAYPENHAALNIELNSRENELALYREAQTIKEQKNIERLVKLVGSFQILTAIVFILNLFISTYSLPEFIGGAFFILLNIIAGYAALKTVEKYYWLSILNQSMQIITFSIGSILISYSGLVAFNAEFSWQNGLGFHLSMSNNAGYIFRILEQPSTSGFFSINIIAVIILMILFIASRNIDQTAERPG